MGAICKNCSVEVDDELVNEAGVCYVCAERSVRLSLRERAMRGLKTSVIPAAGPWPAGLGVEVVKKIVKGL
ncbi:MAG: hypothetical protein K6T65_17040 [Peptococcaceae bacterium]|nr:hypothetical protein [Peptococcaceae bacterium]